MFLFHSRKIEKKRLCTVNFLMELIENLLIELKFEVTHRNVLNVDLVIEDQKTRKLNESL